MGRSSGVVSKMEIARTMRWCLGDQGRHNPRKGGHNREKKYEKPKKRGGRGKGI